MFITCKFVDNANQIVDVGELARVFCLVERLFDNRVWHIQDQAPSLLAEIKSAHRFEIFVDQTEGGKAQAKYPSLLLEQKEVPKNQGRF